LNSVYLVSLKLILNHQESRSLPNVDMVKFRALLGEASLHKKGTCSVSLRVPSQHREIGTKQMTPISKKAAHADGNLKKHEKNMSRTKKVKLLSILR
jgi:hypothetical protein